jgi:hypothetical protein
MRSPFYGPVLTASDKARLFGSAFSNHFNSTASLVNCHCSKLVLKRARFFHFYLAVGPVTSSGPFFKSSEEHLLKEYHRASDANYIIDEVLVTDGGYNLTKL